MAVRARPFFGERTPACGVMLVEVHEIGDDQAFGQFQCGFDGIGQALADTIPDDQTVDHDLDGVFLLLGEFDVIGQLPHFAVDQRAGVAVGAQQFEQVDEFAFASAHDRCQNLESCTYRHGKQRVDHLLRGLCAHRFTAHRAVRFAGAREQQAQVIIDFSDGADRRTRVAVRGLLVDGHCRAESFDEIDVRFVHASQELTGVCAERFDIPALPLGEQGVERQRRFA